MDIFPDTTVYILCPPRVATGGPDALHQLGCALRQRGVNAVMCYGGDMAAPVHPNYRRYHVPYAAHVIDAPQNVAIVPEAQTTLLYYMRRIRRVIWWMSVDHFFTNIRKTIAAVLATPERKFRRTFAFEPELTDIVHLNQSEYARRFLLTNGIPPERIRRLMDYTTPTFTRHAETHTGGGIQGREDTVLYNPKKANEFTQRLIDADASLRWLPLIDMTPGEVAEAMRRAKVYADFGYHPGKERMPREAAVSGCCVITGKRGSARFHEDVPLDDDLKFDETVENVPRILARIKTLFAHYGDEAARLAPYRAAIMSECTEFHADIDRIFVKTCDDHRIPLALVTASPAMCHAAPRLLASTEVRPLYVVDDEQAGKVLRCAGQDLPVISCDDAAWLHWNSPALRFLLPVPRGHADAPAHLERLRSRGIEAADVLHLSIAQGD